MMEPLDLAAIEDRATKATQGPWGITNRPWLISLSTKARIADFLHQHHQSANFDDADFAAHARTDIPALIARVRAAEAEAWLLREALEMIDRTTWSPINATSTAIGMQRIAAAALAASPAGHPEASGAADVLPLSEAALEDHARFRAAIDSGDLLEG